MKDGRPLKDFMAPIRADLKHRNEKRKADVNRRLNELINDYDFPLDALMDISQRMADNDTVEYHEQQVRYLENLVKFKVAKRRKSE